MRGDWSLYSGKTSAPNDSTCGRKQQNDWLNTAIPCKELYFYSPCKAWRLSLQEQLYFFICVYTYDPQVPEHHPCADSSFSYVTGHVAYLVTHLPCFSVQQEIKPTIYTALFHFLLVIRHVYFVFSYLKGPIQQVMKITRL